MQQGYKKVAGQTVNLCFDKEYPKWERHGKENEMAQREMDKEIENNQKKKWKEEWKRKWKQCSASKKSISLILAGAAAVLFITAGLRIWDRSRQKPRVLMGLKQLAAEVSNQDYSLKPLFQLIEEGKTKQEGYINLTLWNEDTLVEYNGLFESIDRAASGIRYQLKFDQKEKLFFGEAEYQIDEIGILDVKSYLTEKTLMVQVPQLHSSYLRMNVENMKERYEQSLLYDILGEKLILPEPKACHLVFESVLQWDAAQEGDMIQAFLKEYEERLPEVWKKITVRKENETKQILVNGVYKNCSVFYLSIPAELVYWYLENMFPKMGVPDTEREARIHWKEEQVELMLYMDDKNRIYRMDLDLEPEVEGASYPSKMICYFKGEKRLLDKVQIEWKSKRQEDSFAFSIEVENQFFQTERQVAFFVLQTEPKQTERIRLNFVMDMITGESNVEYEVNLPLLIFDGEHKIKHLEQPIEEPDGEIVDVFELDLIEFLKFSADFNFGLFR